MIVQKRVYARAGLVGNPSDGYHGKTIAFTFANHHAEVTLYESPELEFRPAEQDSSVFESISGLVTGVQQAGYYGGMRLLKAAVKKFVEYCQANGIRLPERNFTVRYQTNIPRQVGLGGSSAIIMATMKALMGFYGTELLEHMLPNVVLAAETEELGLTAGLQDRVVQSYGGVVYMDFDKKFMEQHGYGRYVRLDVSKLPPLYIAYRSHPTQESGQAHLRVRQLYDIGDKEVISTMEEIAALADDARGALEAGNSGRLAEIMDRNFDLRARIYPITEDNRRMVQLARSVGASCKFCGAGGAVVGTYPTPQTLQELRRVMQGEGYGLLVPEVVGGQQ